MNARYRRGPGAVVKHDGPGDGCPGCVNSAARACAACGQAAVLALDAGDGCSMSLCASCHAIVLDVRASAAVNADVHKRQPAVPLRYVPLYPGAPTPGESHQGAA